MAFVTGGLLIECRMLLHLTQQQFSDIVARTKRTIQRYEERGTTPLPSEVAALARAVCGSGPTSRRRSRRQATPHSINLGLTGLALRIPLRHPIRSTPDTGFWRRSTPSLRPRSRQAQEGQRLTVSCRQRRRMLHPLPSRQGRWRSRWQRVLPPRARATPP